MCVGEPGWIFWCRSRCSPDVVESGGGSGTANTEPPHVGGLPDDLKFKLVEPLRLLFKDEVAASAVVGSSSRTSLRVQPFRDPAWAIRSSGKSRQTAGHLRVPDSKIAREG